MDAKEKQKQRTEKSEVKVGRCDKCGQIKPLRTYRTQQHDRTEGAASYGVTFQHLCEDCKPAPKTAKDIPGPSEKAIKAMLRGARRSL